GTDEQLAFTGDAGDWTGDLVVAHTTGGTVLLQVGDTITVTRPAVADLTEPQFVEGDPTHIMGATKEFVPAGPPPQNAVVSCWATGDTWRCTDHGFTSIAPIRP